MILVIVGVRVARKRSHLRVGSTGARLRAPGGGPGGRAPGSSRFLGYHVLFIKQMPVNFPNYKFVYRCIFVYKLAFFSFCLIVVVFSRFYVFFVFFIAML